MSVSLSLPVSPVPPFAGSVSDSAVVSVPDPVSDSVLLYGAVSPDSGRLLSLAVSFSPLPTQEEHKSSAKMSTRVIFNDFMIDFPVSLRYT